MGKFDKGGNRGFGGSSHGGHGGGFGGRGGRPSFGGGRPSFNRGGDRGPVSMHTAVCDDCKNTCEVPFRPTDGKPVYCKDCFAKRGGGPAKGAMASGHRPDFNKDTRDSFSANDIKTQLAMLNIKLDKILKEVSDSPSTPAVKPVVVKEVKTETPVSAPVKVVAKKKTVVSKEKKKKVSKK